MARAQGVSVDELVSGALRALGRRRNDFQGGGLTRAQAAQQRKALLRDIDKDHRRKELAKLADLRKRIAAIKSSAKGSRSEAVQACRVGRQLAKERAKKLRADGLAALRSAAEQERLAAREACNARKAKVRASVLGETQRARRELAEEKRYQRELRRLEQHNAKKERTRTTSRERRAESDDEVRANIPPEMVALFDRVKRSIRPSERESRTEAFLKYAEENPGELVQAMQADADRELRRLQHEAAKEERRLRKAGFARELAAVPF